jgi:hypothetical protein
MLSRLFAFTMAIVICASLPGAVRAHDYKIAIAELANSEIREWAQDRQLIKFIKDQNEKYAELTLAEIYELDKLWRAELKSGEFEIIEARLANELSVHLRKLKLQSNGKYIEIFVMDNKGLIVGLSDVTSDFWQGDEAKWLKSYGAGPDGILVEEVKFDESTQTYQSQVSIAIVDPKARKPVGAVTVGINVGMLE